jgi:Tol biopolymer transport system component
MQMAVTAENPRFMTMIMGFPDGHVIRQFDLNQIAWEKWAPKGKAILYQNPQLSLSNVWQQPFAGGTPKPVTSFPDDLNRIADFAWSPDGKTLAISRGQVRTDVVLIGNIH